MHCRCYKPLWSFFEMKRLTKGQRKCKNRTGRLTYLHTYWYAQRESNASRWSGCRQESCGSAVLVLTSAADHKNRTCSRLDIWGAVGPAHLICDWQWAKLGTQGSCVERLKSFQEFVPVNTYKILGIQASPYQAILSRLGVVWVRQKGFFRTFSC